MELRRQMTPDFVHLRVNQRGELPSGTTTKFCAPKTGRKPPFCVVPPMEGKNMRIYRPFWFCGMKESQHLMALFLLSQFCRNFCLFFFSVCLVALIFLKTLWFGYSQFYDIIHYTDGKWNEGKIN